MSTILITGADGFVGKHLANELLNNGNDIISVSGPGKSYTDTTRQRFLSVNLLNEDALDTVDLTTVSGVIHLAGLASLAPSFEAPRQYIETNIGLAITLFEAAIKQNVRPRFLVVSSGTIYDPAATLPLTEASNVVPNSPYAVSKIGEEQISRYYAKRGFEVVIARPFNHIGPGQNTGFIVPDITEQVVAAERGDQEMVLVGNLDAQRDYTDVRDIARAYRLLLESGRSGEVYNICSGKGVSGHDLLKHILYAADSHARVEQDPSRMRPSDTPVVYGNHDKLTRDTGWQPAIDLAATLADVVADWRSRAT